MSRCLVIYIYIYIMPTCLRAYVRLFFACLRTYVPTKTHKIYWGSLLYLVLLFFSRLFDLSFHSKPPNRFLLLQLHTSILSCGILLCGVLLFTCGYLRPNPQETADLVTFTEEILNGKLYFLCSVACTETAIWGLVKKLSKTMDSF